jgi:Holliday junction DNA helicase RuvA
MIAYLEGPFTYKSPAYLIIDVGGIGYQVHISLHTWSAISTLTKGRLHTHLHIKEDAHTLYGFFSVEERDLFVQMISVSGIGPNTGRMVLSSMSPGEFKEAIWSENEALIKSIKGIGPKTAKRMILELKDKIGAPGSNKQETSSVNMGAGHNTSKEEALSALVQLGFSRTASEKAIAKVIHQDALIESAEELIKGALKNL